MSYKASLKLGQMAIQVEAEDVKELIKQVSFFCELPSSCGNCRKSSLGFRHRNVQGNDFYEVICENPECAFTFPLGTHKVGGTLFANHQKGWQPPYQKTND